MCLFFSNLKVSQSVAIVGILPALFAIYHRGIFSEQFEQAS